MIQTLDSFKRFYTHFFETRYVHPKTYNHALLCNDFPMTKGFHRENISRWKEIDFFS